MKLLTFVNYNCIPSSLPLINMSSSEILFFFLLPYSFSSVLMSPKNEEFLLGKIMEMVFRSGKICFVHDNTSISPKLEKALTLTNFSLNSFSVDYFTSSQLSAVRSELQQACCDTLIILRQADDFLGSIFDEDFKKQIPDLIQPHSRMIFVYDKASEISKKLMMNLVNEFAIDVITVENLQPEKKSQFFSVESARGKNLRVKSLYRNKTILSVNQINGNVKMRWSDFGRNKWTPKFAPGKFFTVSLFHCPPFWYVQNGTLRKGLESRIIDEITKGWPVKYYVDEILQNEDKWNHTLDLVEQRERDAAVCSHWLIRSVSRRIHFTQPIYQVSITFLVKKPQLLPIATFLFQPLQVSVYCAIFGVLILMRVLLYCFRQWRSYRSFSETLHLGVRSINTLLLVLAVFSLLCSTYYSAGLTSNSAHPRVTQDIHSLEDMVAHNIPWVFDFDYYQKYFRSLDNPVLQRLAELYIPGRKILDRTENSAIYVKVLGDKYVNEIEDLPASEWKYYKLLGEYIGHYYAGLILQKNSPFSRVFSEVSQRLLEGGLVQNMFDNLRTESQGFMEVFFTKYVDSMEYLYIDLEMMQGALFLLCMGWLAGIVVFISECWYSRWIRMK
ncbi:uncharacterized protein [Leptinotarsa decemlineata]|uniref:uncharacterized protein n=1 Tax=Leptinotarsa decemlineata TaxID=7539 RepID=UPI003D307595